MSQILNCPNCTAPLRVRPEQAGKSVTCPKCAHIVAVPGAAPSPADPGAFTAESARAGPPPLPVQGAGEEATALPIADEEATEVRPLGRRRTVACPACGEPNPTDARRCRACREPLDDDAFEERRPRSAYKPCPRCGARGATRVTWTPWGSFYGPALFTHVRCPECGYAYNGRTGGPNLVPAIIFVTIPALLIAAILGGLAWLFLSGGRMR